MLFCSVTQQQKTATVKAMTIFTVRISVNWYKGRRVLPIFMKLKFNPFKEDHFRELFIHVERFSNRSIREWLITGEQTRDFLKSYN
jgi:hypothetical protein